MLGLRRYRFHLDRASGPLNVCAVSVNTSASDLRDRMAAKASALVGTDYSRDYVIRHAMQNLVPLATSAGYVRARVREVEAAREPARPGGCAGVQVTITIDVGQRYRWQAASWSGNSVFAANELDRLVGMTPGEPADATRIDRGFGVIGEAYRSKGYITAAVRRQPVFDDATGQISYAVRILEGPQFRMGRLQIVGLEPALADRLKVLWQIAEGDVFDPSYPSRYLADARMRMRQDLAAFKTAEISAKPDFRRFTVEVTITFKPPQA